MYHRLPTPVSTLAGRYMQWIIKCFQMLHRRSIWLWYWLQVTIPGSAPFQRECRKRVVQRVRHYQHLPWIDPVRMHQTRRRMRILESRVIELDMRIGVAGMAVVLFSVGSITLMIWNELRMLTPLGGVTFFVATVCMIGVETIRSTIFPLRPNQFVNTINIPFLGVIVGFTISYSVLWWWFVPRMPMAAAGLVPLIAFLGLLLGLTLLIAMVRPLIHAYRRTTYPDAVIVDRLLHILRLLDHQSAQWRELRFRRHLIDLLEEVALTIEHAYPRVFAGGDIVTTLTFQDTAHQMATAVRDLKQWLYTPKPDTYDHFAETIHTYLLIAVDQQWDAWPRVCPPHPTPAARWRRWTAMLFHRGRIVLSALLPIGMYYLVPGVKEMVPDAYRAEILTVLWGWCGVLLLQLLYPNISQIFSTMKDFRQLLP